MEAAKKDFRFGIAGLRFWLAYRCRNEVARFFTFNFFLLPFALVLFCLVPCALAKYSGGSGEPNNPYLISTAVDLNDIGNHPEDFNSCFLQTADINLAAYTGTQFKIIGPNTIIPFTGVFDGAGYTVSNFTYDCNASGDYSGLFGVVSGTTSEIRNIGLINPKLTGGLWEIVGGLVGFLDSGTVSRCYLSAGYLGTGNRSSNVGGLIGVSRGTLDSCWTDCSVSTRAYPGLTGGYVGGLVAVNSGTVIACCSVGYVSGNDATSGGLVGYNTGLITSCYSNAIVTGLKCAGGLVGNTSGSVEYSYSAGFVSGPNYVGGLSGCADCDHVMDCYWDTEASHQPTSDCGFGRTTAEMKSASTFAGWSCAGGMWRINDGNDYPRLVWENTPGEILTGPPTYGGGSGTPEDPYLIYTAEQLNMIDVTPCHLIKHFKLMDDIDLSGYGDDTFNRIGTLSAFKGSFDGNGHVIANFNSTEGGLFGTISGGQVTNLSFTDSNVAVSYSEQVGTLADCLTYAGTIWNCHIERGAIYGSKRAGGLVGMMDSGAITNCSVECNTTSGSQKAGGLAGENKHGTIESCFVSGTVKSYNPESSAYIGGLVGYNAGKIYNSGCEEKIRGSGYVGGLVGCNAGDVHSISPVALISGCYASVILYGQSETGGLVGLNTGTSIVRDCYVTGEMITPFSHHYSTRGGLAGMNEATIENCYSALDANTSDANIFGGLVGCCNGGTISACFWDVNATGLTNAFSWDCSAGAAPSVVYSKGLTTEEMYEAWTYAPWACSELWTIDEGNDYPRLAWQNLPGASIDIAFVYPLGAGDTISPYLIDRPEQIRALGFLNCLWDKSFRMTADIDMAEFVSTDINAIGWSAATPFAGIFDGDGYSIFNFTRSSSLNWGQYLGLFGCVRGATAEIKNVGMINPQVTGPLMLDVGALAGALYSGRISNCRVVGGTVSGRFQVGGLVGNTAWEGGDVEQSYAVTTVSGQWSVGGLVGMVVADSNVVASFSESIVLDSGNNAGGLVGYNAGHITNSYARGQVQAASQAGGLVGDNHGGSVSTSYSASYVDANSAGGLVGLNSGSVVDSFWDVQTSDQNNSAGGIGLLTYEMKAEPIYLIAGWDFVDETINGPNDIWAICETTNYPRLSWSIPIADMLCPDGVTFVDYSYLAGRWLWTEYGDVNGLELSGDGKIAGEEFAILGNWWKQSACGDCGGADYTGDGNIDSADLAMLCDNWLVTDYGDVEGAELTGDGKVDIEDVRLFCEQWLTAI